MDLPHRRPFTSAQAHQHGLSANDLSRACLAGDLRRLLRGVYVDAAAEDTLALRVDAVSLAVPAGAVVTDETAGWLHGAPMILPPNADVVVPPVSAFHTSTGCRIRRGPIASGERRLSSDDVVALGGLWATTPLRTACDLGRLRPRLRALAALDQLLALEAFTQQRLLAETHRFRGYRGVVQLRSLARVADARAESPPESALRLHALDAGIPPMCPQFAVPGPDGQEFHLDLALEPLRFAVEYDGVEHHSRAPDVDYDTWRREYLTDELGWHITVVRSRALYGAKANPATMLAREYEAAHASLSRRRLLWAA